MDRFSSLVVPSSNYLPYTADPSLLAAAHHYSTANQGEMSAIMTTERKADVFFCFLQLTKALAVAAAAHANSQAFLFDPPASHPFSISALFAAERFNKSTSIADLRLKAQKHAAALGLQ
jgi:hypothetical protein